MSSPSLSFRRRWIHLGFVGVIVGGLAWGLTSAAPRPPNMADGYIVGVVESTNGPEAGVWVIAETNELKTPFIKIVVTDDDGRYVLPELPEASR